MSVSTRKVKTDYRHVLLALRADIKAYGGYSKAAKLVDVTEDTLSVQTNPTTDVNPPTLGTFLELVNGMEAKRTVAALASLVGQITLDDQENGESTECEIQTFLSLVANASKVMGDGSNFAKDNRFSADEREELLPLLMSLMQVAGHLYRKLNR